MSLPVNAGWLASARLALANVAAEQPCRTPLVACGVCTAPVDGYALCRKCSADRNGQHGHQLADLVVPLAYAWDGQTQLGKDVYTYKQHNQQLAASASGRLRALVYTFGALHGQCPQRRLSAPVTVKAVVPSLKGNHGTALASMADGFLPNWPRIPVAAAGAIRDDASRRALDPTHFTVDPRHVPRGAHVLVLEDTWVTGGHSQALAAALKEAGAAIVTLVPICRLLNLSWAPNRTYWDSTYRRAWNSDTCPVTGGACP